MAAAASCGTEMAFVAVAAGSGLRAESGFGLDPYALDLTGPFCAHVAREPEPVVIEDVTADVRFVADPLFDALDVRFAAGAPVIADGVCLGVVCALSAQAHAPTPTQLRALTALADQLAAVIALQRRHERLASITPAEAPAHSAERFARYQAALMELARSSSHDLDAAYERITRIDAETLEVQRASIWMYDAAESCIVCSKLYDTAVGGYQVGARLAAPDFPDYFAALRRNRVIAATDARTDPRTCEFRDSYLDPLGIRAMLDVPVWREGRVVGIVCHEHTGGVRRWSLSEQDFAASVADMVSLALEASDRLRAEEAVRAAQAELEHRVEARTAELALANEALQEEVAERLRAETELVRRSHELRAIVEAFPDLHFRLAGNGRILEVNAGHAPALYLPVAYFIGRPMQEVLPPAAGAMWSDAIARVRDSGSLVSIEYKLEIANELRSFEARLLPLPGDNLFAVVRDITDARRTAAELESREAHFRSLIENGSDVIAIVAVDGTMRYQSPSIAKVLGYRPDELVGQPVFDFIHPDDISTATATVGRLLDTPSNTHAAEFRFRHRDGSWRSMEAVGKPMVTDGLVDAIVVNARDITGRKRAEEALQLAIREGEEARESAELANRAKSEFLSRMSHELRTPMNSILGFAQLLSKKNLPPDHQKGVDHILKAGQHLLSLINEVLDIARIETNRQHLSIEPVSVSAVVFESMSLIRPLAAQRDVDVSDAESVADYYVRADRQRLTQVLLNLLSNAVKYNRPGGTVTVTLEPTGGDGDEALKIHVHDTGIGIAPARMDRLFVPFERLGAEQSEVEGTGLGLALSQRLVEAMGGSLEVESEPGVGSRFTVELPRVESPVQRVSGGGTPLSTADGPGRAVKLLYIEDNLANLSLIETILGARDEVTLLPALQGQLGLDLAWEHDPDLILLDLHLPDMSGEEVLRRLRADARTRHTPIVVITADATIGRSSRLMASGATAYLTKPLDIDRFLALVDRTLGGGAG